MAWTWCVRSLSIVTQQIATCVLFSQSHEAEIQVPAGLHPCLKAQERKVHFRASSGGWQNSFPRTSGFTAACLSKARSGDHRSLCCLNSLIQGMLRSSTNRLAWLGQGHPGYPSLWLTQSQLLRHFIPLLSPHSIIHHRSYIPSSYAMFSSIKNVIGPTHPQGEGIAQGLSTRGRNHGGHCRAHHPESVREEGSLLSDIIFDMLTWHPRGGIMGRLHDCPRRNRHVGPAWVNYPHCRPLDFHLDSSEMGLGLHSTIRLALLIHKRLNYWQVYINSLQQMSL